MSSPLDRHFDKRDEQEARWKSEHEQRVAAAVEARREFIALCEDFLRRAEQRGLRPEVYNGGGRRFINKDFAYHVVWAFSDYRRGVWLRPGPLTDEYDGKKTRWVPLSQIEIFGVNESGDEIRDSVTPIMHSWIPDEWKHLLDRHLDAAGDAMARILSRGSGT